MIFQNLTNLELLSILVDEETAHKLRGQSLAALVADEGVQPTYPRIAAARELVARALKEELERGPVLANPAMVRDFFRLLLMGKEHEVFMALFLDAQLRMIEVEELFRGTLTQTSVYPREVVKRALHFNASTVIFAHNHPSGVAEPSRADELLTQSLKQALALVDIRVLDHFVVGGNAVLSFAERGLV